MVYIISIKGLEPGERPFDLKTQALDTWCSRLPFGVLERVSLLFPGARPDKCFLPA